MHCALSYAWPAACLALSAIHTHRVAHAQHNRHASDNMTYGGLGLAVSLTAYGVSSRSRASHLPVMRRWSMSTLNKLETFMHASASGETERGLYPVNAPLDSRDYSHSCQSVGSIHLWMILIH